MHPDGQLREDLVGRLRRDLRGWTVDAVGDLLGPVASAALDREQPLPALLRVRDLAHDARAVLLALFVLGEAVPLRRADAALPALGVEGAERLGLVRSSGRQPGDAVRALVELRPHAAVDDRGTADWWLVSDLADPRTGAPRRPDHVLGVGGASLTLARSTIRFPVGRVLDVGTGCGVQALHAARHARHVTATDTSRRALGFARLGWALNAEAVEGVEADLRRGDLLEPVAGETFDLVVSNPPFVITPRAVASTVYEYRDAGMVGDAFTQRLVTTVGAVLGEGGVAQVLANWEHRRGEPWADRVGAWLDRAGLDGWVLQREVQDPAQYAELWMRDAGQHVGPGADALYAAWLEDFARRGVDAVGFGLVVLRRPASGRVTLRRLEDVQDAPSLPAGHEVAAALAAADWLAGTSDVALLEARLAVAGDVTEERHHRPGDADPTVILLRRGSSGRSVRVSGALAGVVGACDGDLPVGRIVAAVATLLDEPAADLVASLLPAVRSLVADGFLAPAPSRSRRGAAG